MIKNVKLILSAMALVIAGLVALVLYQWSELISKKLTLQSSQTALTECEQELTSAENVLAEVSSTEYKELTAREKGLGKAKEIAYLGSE